MNIFSFRCPKCRGTAQVMQTMDRTTGEKIRLCAAGCGEEMEYIPEIGQLTLELPEEKRFTSNDSTFSRNLRRNA